MHLRAYSFESIGTSCKSVHADEPVLEGTMGARGTREMSNELMLQQNETGQE